MPTSARSPRCSRTPRSTAPRPPRSRAAHIAAIGPAVPPSVSPARCCRRPPATPGSAHHTDSCSPDPQQLRQGGGVWASDGSSARADRKPAATNADAFDIRSRSEVCSSRWLRVARDAPPLVAERPRRSALDRRRADPPPHRARNRRRAVGGSGSGVRDPKVNAPFRAHSQTFPLDGGSANRHRFHRPPVVAIPKRETRSSSARVLLPRALVAFAAGCVAAPPTTARRLSRELEHHSGNTPWGY